MMSSGITCSVSGQVGVITLDRPEVLNAVDSGMRRQLLAAFDAFADDDAIGAIVLTGRGPRAFCVGGNFNELEGAGEAEAMGIIASWGELYRRLGALEKPLVAALNGVAVGAGFQLALLADLRVGHAGIRLGQPEINIGIATALGPYLMSRVVGPARAAELTLSGRLVETSEAERLGLLDRVVPEGDVLGTAIALAADLAAKPRIAIAMQKRHFAGSFGEGLAAAILAGRSLMREAYASGVPQELVAKARAAKTSRRPT
jgi:enoyl-CoA hydratase/carnithine racemase